MTCWTGDAIQMVVRTPTLVALYWSRVGRDPALTCWPWVGALSDHGHGRFWVAGRCVGAHRIGWALAHPDAPLPEMVTHDCDTPSCQNPTHLRAGDVVFNNAEYRARAGMPGSPFQPSTTPYTDTIHEAETEPPIPVRNINELINPTNHA